jgi:hypothetical protein
MKFLICRRKIPLQTIPFSKERIQTLIGGVKQAKDATKPSGNERTLAEEV